MLTWPMVVTTSASACAASAPGPWSSSSKWVHSFENIKLGKLPRKKGWLATAKLKPLSLFISLLSMLKKAFDNVKIET